MNQGAIIGLINNVALLMALGLVYDIFFLKKIDSQSVLYQGIAGGFLGLIGVAVMLNPWEFIPGVIFDTRSVLLCVSGFFFGAIPTAITVGITGAYRIIHGGPGVWSGVGVIVTSGLVGWLWRRRPAGISTPSFLDLYTLGVLVHVLMLLWMFVMPWPVALRVLSKISLPVLVIYPVCTALLGMLLARQETRAETDRALREGKELIQTVIDNIPLMFVFSDADGRFRYVNRNFEKTLGCTLEEAQHLNIMERFYPDPDYRLQVMDFILKAEGKWHLFKTCAMDGSVIDTLWKNIKLADGSIIGIGEDATERIKAQKEREELESQFHQAQKMEAVGRLAGGVAHDFNNLLSIILGYAEMVSEDIGKDHAQQEGLTAIFDASIRARNLTRQLLAFGRKQVLEVKTFDVNEVIRDFRKLVQRIIGEEIELVFDLMSTPAVIKADIGQFEQVLMNLVINAKDAMPEGGQIVVQTGIVELDEYYASEKTGVVPGNYVMVQVSDTGMGIDAETQAHIFEPFFTTKGRDRGTGLGLATVYGIVKQHRGNVWVYSEQGRGTIFKIYFPVAEGSAAENAPVRRNLEVRSENFTILVVEDAEAVRKLACRILGSLGYEVIEAENEMDAVDKARARSGTIHLLLTDVIMPNMNGPEVYRQIREFNPDIKVLYMSGYAVNGITRQGILLDGIDIIQKPLTKRSLGEKVAEVLGTDG